MTEKEIKDLVDELNDNLRICKEAEQRVEISTSRLELSTKEASKKIAMVCKQLREQYEKLSNIAQLCLAGSKKKSRMRQ